MVFHILNDIPMTWDALVRLAMQVLAILSCSIAASNASLLLLSGSETTPVTTTN